MQICRNLSRVAITGAGILTAIGTQLDETWKAIENSKSGIRFWEQEKLRIPAGVVQSLKSTSERVETLSLEASQHALKDAGIAIESIAPERIGISVSSSKGDFLNILSSKCPFILEKANARLVSYFNAQGPALNLVGACSTGLQSVSWGARWIQENRCDMVLAGASDSVLNPFLIHAYQKAGILGAAQFGESPDQVLKPFDRRRTGTVLGEGSGVIVLEPMQKAKKRGAKIYGEILSCYYGMDAYHPIRMNPEGLGIHQALSHLHQKARLPLDAVDYVNLHGTGTIWNDRLETRGIKSFFKDHSKKISLSSTKPFTGHLVGASGVVELIISLLAMRHEFIPPTLNLEEPDPECPLDYAPGHGKERKMNALIGLAYGFGGQVGAILVKKIEG